MVFYGDRAPTASELADAFDAYIKVEDLDDLDNLRADEDVPPSRAEMSAALNAYQAAPAIADERTLKTS
ncbi:hypothetical protein P7C70_g6730, partial [Phenoliferia sp. Uapishka_3]